MTPRLLNKVLVIDVETTGLDPSKNACIEIGAVLLDERLHPIDEFQSLVAPWEGAEIVEAALAVSRISLDELRKARPIHVVIAEFHQQFCLDEALPLLAGWNVWFDVAFLKDLYERAELDWPFRYRLVDVQSIVSFFARLRDVSQERVIEAMLGERQLHRALEDARHTARLLILLAEETLPKVQLELQTEPNRSTSR